MGIVFIIVCLVDEPRSSQKVKKLQCSRFMARFSGLGLLAVLAVVLVNEACDLPPEEYHIGCPKRCAECKHANTTIALGFQCHITEGTEVFGIRNECTKELLENPNHYCNYDYYDYEYENDDSCCGRTLTGGNKFKCELRRGSHWCTSNCFDYHPDREQTRFVCDKLNKVCTAK